MAAKNSLSEEQEDKLIKLLKKSDDTAFSTVMQYNNKNKISFGSES
jgi:succinate dehydrogenase flavin-adding protein (antitoxin of CptAB toxin-antitoxin module)